MQNHDIEKNRCRFSMSYRSLKKKSLGMYNFMNIECNRFNIIYIRIYNMYPYTNSADLWTSIMGLMWNMCWTLLNICKLKFYRGTVKQVRINPKSSSESSSLLTSDDNLSISIDIEASAFKGVAKSDATTTRPFCCCTHLVSTSSPDARSRQVRYSWDKPSQGSCLEEQ